MKCVKCTQKTILFTCKCNKMVCIKHRMPDQHVCVTPELFKVPEIILKDKIQKI